MSDGKKEPSPFDTWNPVQSTPYGRLNSGASTLGEEEVQEVLAVIRSRSLSRDYGPDCLNTVLRFEQAFARQTGARYALAVTSGTAALKVALVAAGVGPGHEVIVPACTFIATPGAVVAAGAVPIFAEIDESLTLDPDDLEAKITPRTRAILPVHLSGVPCQMDRISEIAKRHNLKIVEDCAQSCGTAYQGRQIGTWGDLGAFSLQFSKIITSGEGGVVTSDDPDLYERAVRYHDQGSFREKDRFPGLQPHLDEFVGENYRMPELTGAVALQQLARLNEITGTLRTRFRRFQEGISGIKGLRLRPVNDEAGHLGVRWGLVFDDAGTCKRFSEALRARGLSPGLSYGGKPVYLQPQILNQATATPEASPWKSPLYKGEVTYGKGLCPRSEDILQRVLMIASINPRYADQDVDQIVEAVRQAAGSVP
ncbi:MAG: DegT/DnrJ/EryC1/StrS family aminotransferase [Candidatus Latescibacteria bacterium]|nr:DegT/DnrJ/EryC1/StrS family aminotransferase [Candidatus Latescibacterota bacterium]